MNARQGAARKLRLLLNLRPQAANFSLIGCRDHAQQSRLIDDEWREANLRLRRQYALTFGRVQHERFAHIGELFQMLLGRILRGIPGVAISHMSIYACWKVVSACPAQLNAGRFGILNRVVQQRRGQDFRVAHAALSWAARRLHAKRNDQRQAHE